MNTRNLVLTVLVAALSLLFIWFMWMQNVAGVDLAEITPTTTPEVVVPTENAASTSTVLLAMLDTAQITNGPSRGCDQVVMVNQQIPTTTAPLTAALNALFAISTTTVDGWFNYMPRTSGTLSFASATVVNGTANIYLTGTLSGMAGVCDDPRAEIQIEETALQFPTVQQVQLYLNNQPVTTLAPSMK
ncbi:MAG: GerMN domain-containing protein [Candidatus Pacebacteria bacterium]|nr:GerMN domain-containing protein [Candidatus Paceibacterota bacterium]